MVRRKFVGKILDEPKPPSEYYDEQQLRLETKGKKKKRVVSKYKPSRHSR